MADAGSSINGSISLASRVTALRNGLFQALIVMQKRGAHGNGASVMSTIGLLIKWLQMMAFLYISPDFNWNKDISAPIRVLALIPSPAGWFKVLSPVFLNALFFISFVWVLCFCSLMIWTVRNFLKGQIPNLTPLKVLARVGQFSATVAYIPLLTMLLSVYMCGAGEVQSGTVDQWASTGYACLKGGHLALVVLATIFSTVFASLAALFAVVFYDNHPLSRSLASKVHGRAEFILLIIKTVLILTIEIFPTKLGGPWALIGINIAAAACWVGVILYYMPMMHHRMNALHMALGSLYLWAGICLAIGMSSTVDGAVILYVGSPVALGVGVALAGWRRDSVMSRPTSKLANVYEIEMKSRFTLMKTVAALMEMSTAMATKSETSALMQEDDDIGIAVASGGLGTARAGAARFEDMTSPRSLPDAATKSSARRGSARDSRSKKSTDESDFAIFAASYRALDSESRERILKDKLPLKTLLECEAMFKNGVMRFPTSAVLHIFQSQFYSVFKHDRHLATSHLLLTNRLSPALDIAYLAFQARRAAENAGSAGVLSSAMHRVSFDKHLADAKLSTMKAAQAQVSFWQELCDTKPDINNLHQIAAQLSIHTALAESNFKEAFALHPQSLAAMRLFAQYNLSVANNPEKASAISAEAERIEDQKNKEQNAPAGGNTNHTGFPFNEEVPLETMTDAVAMVTVGATSRDLGIIISANAAACKLLGYTRLQLERRNVSIIVPSPFMESHDLYMRRYLSTGEGRFVETVRSTLGKHRLGHLVPMSIMIKETNLSDNTPVFHATLRPINFSDHVIQMDEDWMVVGGTAGALMALQVDAPTLAASEVCMADYCPTLNDAEAVTDLMGRAQGDVVQMRLPGFSAGPSAQGGDPNGGGSSTNGNSKSLRGSMVSSESFAAPLALDAHGGSRVDPWSKPVDVKATLASYNQKGNHINILTFRLLSTNEQAQRANAQASRRASIAAGGAAGMGRPLPSFRRSLASQDGGPFVRTPQVPGLSRDRSGESAGSVNDSVKSGADHDSVALGLDDNSRAGSPGADSAGLPASHPPINASSFAGAVCPIMRSSPQRSQDCSESEAPVAAVRVAVRVSSSPPAPLSALGAPGSVGTTDPSAARKNFMKKKAASVRILDEAVEVEGQMVPTPYGRLSHGKGDIDHGEKARAARWGRSGDDEEERQEHRVYVYEHRSSSPVRKAHEDMGDEKHNNRRSSINNDGKGSVRSGGSGSKRSSVGRTTLNKLRRIVAESASGVGNTKGVPGLSLLYLTGWLLLVLNMGLGVLTAILLDANFVDYARNLRFAAVAGVTTQQQTLALRLLIQRSLYNRGWLAADAADDRRASATMAAVADLYASSTSRMYSLVDGTDRSSFFTAPVLEYVDFSEAVPEPNGRVSENVLKAMLLGKEFWPWSMGNGAVLVGTRRMTTLLDFSALWTGTLKQLSNMPTANITTDEAQVLFVVANTQPGAPAHEYIRRAIFESYLASEDSQKLVTTLVLWIFVAMGPVLGAVLLTVVIPILLYIDHKRDNIMESFLDLPALIIMYLRAGAERRLRSLRSDEEGGEGSEDDEEEEETRRALSLGIDGENPDLELEDGTVDWEAVFARVTVEASRAEKKRMKKLMGGNAKGASGEAAGAASGSSPKASARACCARSAGSEAAEKSAVHHRSMCSRGTRAPGGYYRSVVNADGTVSTFIRRDYKKSSKSFVSLAAVFLVPVLLMFVFYLVLYLVTMNTVDRVIAMSAFTSLSAMRAAAFRSSVNAVMYMVGTPGYAPEEAFRYEFTSQKIVDTVATNKLLVYDVRTFAQTGVDGGIGPSLDYKKSEGTESSSVPGMPAEAMAHIRTAQDKDACPFIHEALGHPASFDMVKCREFNGGVLTSGLQAGLRDFVRRLRKLRDRRWNADVPVNTSDGTGILSITTSSDWGTAFEGTTLDGSNNGLTNVADGGTYVQGSSSTTAAGQGETLSGLNNTVTVRVPYSIVRELQSEDWLIADNMMRSYLLPAFTYTTESYGDSGEQIVTDYRVFLMAFVGGFLGLYTLGTLFLYLPAITTLAKDVQSKRAMLLLLPATIIAKVPSLRAMVLQIVAEHESGGSAAATVGRGEAVEVEEAPPAVAVDSAA